MPVCYTEFWFAAICGITQTNDPTLKPNYIFHNRLQYLNNIKKNALFITCLPLFFLTVFFSNCQKNNQTPVNASIACFGHAGMGSQSIYPQNSLESVLKCYNSGADGTDLDVQITKDSVLILFHDESLNGTSNLSGPVFEKTWSEIKTAYYTQQPNAPYPIVRLADVLSMLPLKTFSLSLDCKFKNANPDKPYLDWFARQLNRVCSSQQDFSECLVESVNPYFLNHMQALNSKFKAVLYTHQFEVGSQTAIEQKFYGISMSLHEISAEQINKAHQATLHVIVWDVSTRKQHEEALLKQPDIIQSDNVPYLVNRLSLN